MNTCLDRGPLTNTEVAFALHDARRTSERAVSHRHRIDAVLHAILVSATAVMVITDLLLLMQGAH